MATTVFVTVVLLRFLLPLAIPRFPLPAIIACLVLDAADQTIFQAVTDDPLPGYQTYDKALDVFYLAIAYISTMRNWTDPVAFQVSRFLFFYRLAGVLMFELFDERWLLLVFPNTFEYFFIAYEAIRTRWNPLRLSAVAVVGMAAFIWVFVKLPQEWWIHVAQLDFTEFMAAHTWMWIVLAAVAVAAATAGWLLRARIPAPDWPFTVDIDDHLEPSRPTAGPERFFSTILFEKVVLLATISVIFSQVLPSIHSTELGLALGVSALVVANAAVTQWLRRRGRSWETSARELVAMLLINAVIVTIDALVGSGKGADAPALNTLFFLVLLSLLITLFDRYRALRRTTDGPGVFAAFRAARAGHAAG